MIASVEKVGTSAVKKLRLDKLNNRIPFMINSRELPKEQCYLEYPTGIIKLPQISADKNDFNITKEFSLTESTAIRRKFHLV